MKKGLSVYEIWFCEEFIHEFISACHVKIITMVMYDFDLFRKYQFSVGKDEHLEEIQLLCSVSPDKGKFYLQNWIPYRRYYLVPLLHLLSTNYILGVLICGS